MGLLIDEPRIVDLLRHAAQGRSDGVAFRWPGLQRDTEIPYTQWYGSVAKEIGLYGSAIRQLEPFAEYLYNENRCGIANGGHEVKEHDFGRPSPSCPWMSTS